MEIVKKNIHMDGEALSAEMQLALDEDINVPDSKPDVSTILLKKGEVEFLEVRPGTDQVMLKGVLHFSLLYYTVEPGCSLVNLEGQLPFEERVNVDGAKSTDSFAVDCVTEDLTVNLINSRKLGIKALLCLEVCSESLADTSVPVDVTDGEELQYCRKPVKVRCLAVSKKDIYRVKEEITISDNYPNIHSLLWENAVLSDMSYRAEEGQIRISGELRLFLLFEGEGESHPVRSYETVLPISGVVDINGADSLDGQEITGKIGRMELTVRPDSDGEERCISIDMTVDLNMKLYREEELQMISDLYAPGKETTVKTTSATLPLPTPALTGKAKVSGNINLQGSNVIQLINCFGDAVIEKQTVTEDGVLLQGVLEMQILYVTGTDAAPYGCSAERLPFNYLLECRGLQKEAVIKCKAGVDKLQASVSSGEEIEVKAVISCRAFTECSQQAEVIEEVTTQAISSEKRRSLPGMAVYVVQPGDNLWTIGKKYYVSVDSIRSSNGLESDELRTGQKLLIV